MRFLGSDQTNNQPILLNNHQTHKINVDIHPLKKETNSEFTAENRPKLPQSSPNHLRFSGFLLG